MKPTDYAACLALDWGEDEHAFVLQPHAGSREKGMVSASPETMHGWFDRLHERFEGKPVAVVVEAGRNAVIHALWEHPWLTVYPIHPAASAKFRETLVPSGAKDDLPDASVLLELFLHHYDRLRPLRPDTPETRRLDLLVTARRDAVDHRTQLTNQLGSVLKGYFPQLRDLVGDELYTPLPLDFLTRWPSLTAVQAARPSTLRQFYYRHRSRRSEVVEQRVAGVATARPLTTDATVIETGVLQMQMLIALLRPLQKSIDHFDDAIAEAFAAHPDAELFRHLPGAGPVLAPRLLVGFDADRLRYPTAASLQKLSGIAPVREKSGRQIWTHWRWHCPNSCARVSSSGQVRPYQNARGPKPITAPGRRPAWATTPSCAPSPSSGSASSGAAGKIASLTTIPATSKDSKNVTLPTPSHGPKTRKLH